MHGGALPQWQSQREKRRSRRCFQHSKGRTWKRGSRPPGGPRRLHPCHSLAEGPSPAGRTPNAGPGLVCTASRPEAVPPPPRPDSGFSVWTERASALRGSRPESAGAPVTGGKGQRPPRGAERGSPGPGRRCGKPVPHCPRAPLSCRLLTWLAFRSPWQRLVAVDPVSSRGRTVLSGDALSRAASQLWHLHTRFFILFGLRLIESIYLSVYK